MKRNRTIGRAALTAGVAILAVPLFLAGPVSAQQAAAQKAGPATPMASPKILVVNRDAILRFSKVGQDIVRQVNAYTNAAEKEFKGQGDALRKQGEGLQQQMAILAPDVKAKKIADFEGKQRALQSKVKHRQDMIQGGVIKARQEVEKALAPIIQGIMQERGGNILLDRDSVVWASGNIDITRTAIERLDKKMTKVKVELTEPPSQAQGG
jgi:Skp family chaperone for outer membrane proteins